VQFLGVWIAPPAGKSIRFNGSALASSVPEKELLERAPS
jgi:hypothetical protein